MPNIRSQTQDSLYWGKIVDGIAIALDQEGLGMVIISENRADNFVNILNPNGILGLIGVVKSLLPCCLRYTVLVCRWC